MQPSNQPTLQPMKQPTAILSLQIIYNVSFFYTGSIQSWSVPFGVAKINVIIIGKKLLILSLSANNHLYLSLRG
jgi:hypothetical protein